MDFHHFSSRLEVFWWNILWASNLEHLWTEVRGSTCWLLHAQWSRFSFHPLSFHFVEQPLAFSPCVLVKCCCVWSSLALAVSRHQCVWELYSCHSLLEGRRPQWPQKPILLTGNRSTSVKVTLLAGGKAGQDPVVLGSSSRPLRKA